VNLGRRLARVGRASATLREETGGSDMRIWRWRTTADSHPQWLYSKRTCYRATTDILGAKGLGSGYLL